MGYVGFEFALQITFGAETVYCPQMLIRKRQQAGRGGEGRGGVQTQNQKLDKAQRVDSTIMSTPEIPSVLENCCHFVSVSAFVQDSCFPALGPIHTGRDARSEAN